MTLHTPHAIGVAILGAIAFLVYLHLRPSHGVQAPDLYQAHYRALR